MESIFGINYLGQYTVHTAKKKPLDLDAACGFDVLKVHACKLALYGMNTLYTSLAFS